MMDLARLVEVGEAEAYADMFRAAPAPLAQALGVEVLSIGDGIGLMVSKVDAAEFNRVLGLGVTRPARPEHLDELTARYRPLGLSKARFQLSPGAEPQGPLRGWLAERGMAETGTAWTKRARRSDPPIDAPTDLSVVDAADAPGQFGAVAAAGFGMPPILADWLNALVGRPNWRTFVALAGEKPVAAGALFLGDDYGWLGIGATLADARGRGGQGAIMRARVEVARAAGKAWVITETGAPAAGEAPGPSYRNMDRHGFEEIHLRPNYQI